MVTTSVDIVTWALVTAIVSNSELSLNFLMTIFPVPFCTFLLKSTAKFAFKATPVAPSAGVKLSTVNAGLCAVSCLHNSRPCIPSSAVK